MHGIENAMRRMNPSQVGYRFQVLKPVENRDWEVGSTQYSDDERQVLFLKKNGYIKLT